MGVNAGIAAGPGLPIELHGMYEVSNVAWSGNLFDLALNWLTNQFSKQDDPCK